jgi:seryl-tRNA synthetase
MLSRDLLRDDPEKVRHGLGSRGMDLAPLDSWVRLDAERRAALVEVEELKRQRNEASRAIGEIKKQGGDAAAQIAAVGQLKARIEELEARLAAPSFAKEDIDHRSRDGLSLHLVLSS